jgi:hypothetical protein
MAAQHGAATWQVCVASNLFAALEGFYGIFPELLKQELYITGESYGGHYVPGFAAYIHAHNARVAESGGMHVPLAGMAIGDGWIDPVNMIPAYPDMIYNFGCARTMVSPPLLPSHASTQLTEPAALAAQPALTLAFRYPYLYEPAHPDRAAVCDENEKAIIQDYCDRTVALIQEGKMLDAFNVWDKFLNGDVCALRSPHSRAEPSMLS